MLIYMVCLTFVQLSKLLSRVTGSHLQNMRGLGSPHPFQHLVLPTFSYSDRCIWTSHCIFDCIPLVANDVWASFHEHICCLQSLFDEISLCALSPFFNWIVWAFFYCEFLKHFMFHTYWSFVGYVVCSDFLPVYSLYFHPFWFTQHLNLAHHRSLSLM